MFPKQAFKHLPQHSISVLSSPTGLLGAPDWSYSQVIAYIETKAPGEWHEWLIRRATKIRDCTTEFCDINRGRLYNSIIEWIDAKQWEGYATNPINIIKDSLSKSFEGLGDVLQPFKAVPTILIVIGVGFLIYILFIK